MADESNSGSSGVLLEVAHDPHESFGETYETDQIECVRSSVAPHVRKSGTALFSLREARKALEDDDEVDIASRRAAATSHWGIVLPVVGMTL